ncbi:hypothetical protein F4806DRAFT_80334 [Annulohypoxylon nitens]|nr:hypothetical protein F4806DRAFT_80334 [Annulohypoxylon nitens]
MAQSSKVLAMEDIMASKPFKFVVGPSRKEFFVHAEALTKVSPVLRDLIATSMIEDTTVLEDMDEEEFSRLCEYAYSGNCKVPVPNSDPPKLSVRPEGDAFQIYRYQRRPLATYLDTYKGEHIKLLAQEYGQPPKVYINNPSYSSELSDKDWTETLLRHANMYIIADRYDVAGLRQLACFYLHHILRSIFRDTWDSILAIEKLVRLTYENTEAPDDLRGLVSGYVAVLCETIFLHPNMDRLRDECNGFSSDVLKFTTKRLTKETAYFEQKHRRRLRNWTERRKSYRDGLTD